MFNHVLKLIDVDLPAEWPRMTYAEAMRRYGSDKPDLRFEMELVDLSDELARHGFCAVRRRLWKQAARSSASSSKARPIIRESRLDELQEFVKRYGAGALGVDQGRRRDDFVAAQGSWRGKDRPSLPRAQCRKGRRGSDRRGPQVGRRSCVSGALRLEIASRENLIDRNRLQTADRHRVPDVRARRRERSATPRRIIRSHRRWTRTSRFSRQAVE